MNGQDSTQASFGQSRGLQSSKQNEIPATSQQYPDDDDKEAWKAYWKVQGQPWRTEPEIGMERQQYLTEQRNIKPDLKQAIYPFKDIQLNRADIEWLLATHENGRGPVDWSDESQREREGLDLRGAHLRGVNLQNLPLARIRGGLTRKEWLTATVQETSMASVLMEGANLGETHLEGAYLGWAYMEGVDLFRANLTGAYLFGSHLEKSYFRETRLEEVDLRRAHLSGAYLERAVLSNQKHVGARLADIDWGNVNLTVMEWSQIDILGDEYEARQNRSSRLYELAVRANRQLAAALQAQGLNEDAARFAYRAQRLQRVVLRKQRKIGSYLFSLFLDLLAGYGYRPGRSVFWYLVIIIGFAGAYSTFGHIKPLEAFILSLTSFHGRGFFPGNNITVSDPRVVLAAFEAVIGLFIEISFIATFTKRFFGS